MKVTALGADTKSAWAYARTLNAEASRLGGGLGSPGTVHWMFQQFFATDKFKNLAATTQRDYRWILRMLDSIKLGPMVVSAFSPRAIQPRHADRVYAMLRESKGIATAHYTCRVARRIWKWGARQGFSDRNENPWTDMELRTPVARDAVWSVAQVNAVIEVSQAKKRPSIGLAVTIAYWTGLRQGDVLSLTWHELEQRLKTTRKTTAIVPLVPDAYPELAAALEVERERQAALTVPDDKFGPPDNVVLICEATGNRWNRWTFVHQFREMADAAGIPKRLQFRDLRATAQTELANAGTPLLEMRTHSGHTTAAMAARYARPTEEQFSRAASRRLAAQKQTDGKPDGKRKRVDLSEMEGIEE
jgi:integrase